MMRRITWASVLLGLVLLAACSPNSDDSRPPPERATVAEAVTALDALVSDTLSIAAGISSNSLLTYLAGVQCGYGVPALFLETSAVPAVYAVGYDLDESFQPRNWRLATGTFSCNAETGLQEYSPSPTDALVFTWPATGGRKSAELRFGWENVRSARVYSYLDRPALPVPGRVKVSASVDGAEVAAFQLDQTLAQTQCGLLAEYRTLNLTGLVRSGSQAVTLTSFALDHSSDEALRLDLVAGLRSGSLELPLSASLEVAAAAVTRDPSTCELNGVEGPLTGAVDLKVGKGQGLVGLEFGWTLTFAGAALSGPATLSLESARLIVGSKYVEIQGVLENFLGARPLDLSRLRLTFKDASGMQLPDFIGRLTIPQP